MPDITTKHWKKFASKEANFGTTYLRILGGVIKMAREKDGASQAEFADRMRWGSGGAWRLRSIEAGNVGPTFEELAVLGHVAFLDTSSMLGFVDNIAHLLADHLVPVFRTQDAANVWMDDTGKRLWDGEIYDLFLRFAPPLNYAWDNQLQHIGQFEYMANNYPELLEEPTE